MIKITSARYFLLNLAARLIIGVSLFDLNVGFGDLRRMADLPQLCEGCGAEATTSDNEGVDLCGGCADMLVAEWKSRIDTPSGPGEWLSEIAQETEK